MARNESSGSFCAATLRSIENLEERFKPFQDSPKEAVLLIVFMKYKNFEELPVWQAAVEFALKVFEFTDKADFRGFGDTKNQLERATVSISNNIAEGFERGANPELIYFLYISKGSAGECRSMLRLCEFAPRFSNFKSEISNLISRAVGISKQLNGWLESLKNSKIKGNRYFTKQDRDKIARDRQFAEFDAQMAEFQRQHLEMLEKRQQDTAMVPAESALD
jgi:four helix bundle protein